MGAYFGTTEITNFDCLVPVNEVDITQVFFATNELFTVWGEYDGTLPAQYSANGSMLADYRIYGAAGGVGDRTEQLFNAETAVYKNGFFKNDSGIETKYTGAGYYTTYIPIAPSETIYVINVRGSQDLTIRLYFYDAQKQWIQRTDGYVNDFSVVAPSNAAYAQLQISQQFIPSPNTIMITRGSTAPAEYVPYGYVMPISVSDGANTTTTPIYVGDEPLEAIGDYADYVDYQSGKIVRSVFNYIFTGTERTWRTFYEWVELFAASIVPNIVIGSGVRSQSPDGKVTFQNFTYSGTPVIHITVDGISVGADIMPYLKSLYDNGTPAVMQYVSSEPVEVDPPVPFPALPTVDGTTITDYAGQSAAPSRFYAKYRKEGFN